MRCCSYSISQILVSLSLFWCVIHTRKKRNHGASQHASSTPTAHRLPVQPHNHQYTSRRKQSPHPISNIVEPKPNIPRIELSSFTMFSPKSPTTASDPKITALEHTTLHRNKRKIVSLSKDSQQVILKQKMQTSETLHICSSPLPDYTEKRKARLMYGH